MASRPTTTKEYFREFGLQEFRGDSWVMGYVSMLAFYCSKKEEYGGYDGVGTSTVLMDAQDYVSKKLGLEFNGYYFGDPPNEKFKI